MRTLLSNANFYYRNRIDNNVKAILVDSGKIDHIFLQGEALPQDASILDLRGLYVYPGFIDTHTHSFEGGLYSAGVDLYDCKNIAEVLEKISDALLKLRNKEDNMLFCWRLDENALAESRFPTVQELDSLSSDTSILIRRIDGHSCVVNSFARKQIAQLTGNQVNVLRGEDNDHAVHWFHGNCGQEKIFEAYQTAAHIALKGGFTTIHTMIGDAEHSITHYSFIDGQLHHFPIEYILYPQSFNLEAALDAGATRIGGCILADGSIGSHTAGLTKPYEDSKENYGTLYKTDDFWYKFIRSAHQHNLQVGVHCLGDRAIRQINNAYLKLAKEDYKDIRHQLIHCEITPNDLVLQIKTSGAIPVMQPAFDHYWGGTEGFYSSRLGAQRTLIMNRLKTFVNNNIKVTGGSDWYITELDAIKGMCAAMNHHNKSERLSPKEAIQIYTSNAAYLSHDETRLGLLEQGFQADFTILDSQLSILSTVENTHVKAVIKRGELVFGDFETII